MAIRKRTWTNAQGPQTAWVVDYKDQHGKRRLKTFQRRKDAEQWWSGQAGYEVAQGIHTPASVSVTVGEAADLWHDHCRAEGLERSTLRQRRQHIDLHLKPFIGSVKLADLRAPTVHAFLDQLRDNGRSVAMRRKVLTNLKTLISHAQGRGLVAQNVARGVRFKASGREEGHEMRAGVEMPTKAELRALMDNASPRWRPFIITAIFTGMRASELRGLRWQDVDLERGVAHVRQRADAWGQIAAPKSKAGRRDIPLAPIVINSLREWRLACPPGELAFPSVRGCPLNPSNVLNQAYKPLQVRCGIIDAKGRAKYGLHALRHAAASLFIEQGWQPKKVQTVLGHASIQMTFDLYGKLFKDEEGDRQAMEKMQAALLTG